jgi:hypothetical protein
VACQEQDSEETTGLTQAEKLQHMVNWMMPLPDRERACGLSRSGEEYCGILIRRSRLCDS